MSKEKEIKAHSRFKGADWYGEFFNIAVGGLGSIGSWTSLLLSRAGHKIYGSDFDHVSNENMAGQFFQLRDVGSLKSAAIDQNIRNFRETTGNMFSTSKIDVDSGIVLPISIAAFDSMTARKSMFERWKQEEQKELFIDGRLSAEVFKIYTVTPDKIDDYEKTLFTDKEAINEVCSFKSTTHCSAAIASFITGIICNYAYNKKYGEKTRPIPFETEFEFPLFNLTIL